ncbi:MAG: hypothetical protein V1492_03805 [Candidatus Micrarchaeota archaeon]
MFGLTSQFIRFVAIVLNCVALVGLALYRYFKPKEWTERTVVNADFFIVIYLFGYVLLACLYTFLHSLSSQGILNWMLIIGISGGIFYLVFQSSKKHGDIPMLLLFILSIAQELYLVLSFSQLTFSNFLAWNVIGLVSMIFTGVITGFIFDLLFPITQEEHHSIISNKFPGSVQKKTFDLNVIYSPANFVGMMIAYSIWLILLQLLFF